MTHLNKQQKANYVVAHYWENTEAIGCYAYFNEVHFGTVEQAQEFKNYVKSKRPDQNWKIFQIVETEL